LLFFLIAFLIMGLVPWTIHMNQPERSLEEIADGAITHEFVELAERFPDHFGRYFPDGATERSFAEALALGRRVYVAEACWHCHSQQIRPVSNEDLRWGPVSQAEEYQNVLQRPVLFGTRRVGPDLVREAARKSNDWHLAHFHKPTSVVPTSVMPEYPWFFDRDGYPNQRGFAIITYVQWLGSWLDEYPYYQGEGPGRPPSSADSTAALANEATSHAGS
jgi:hypothetical protein